MTPVEAVIGRILTVTDVTDLVGQRVYNQLFGQKPTLPAVLAFEVDAIGGQLLRGPDGFSRSRVQVESRAASKPVVDAIADAIHGDGLGLDASGVFGWIGSVGSPAFEIANIEDRGRRSGYDPDELRQFWVQRDYMVIFRGIA